MHYLTHEDDTSFHLSNGLQIAKNASSMAPGGIYHTAKANIPRMATGGMVGNAPINPVAATQPDDPSESTQVKGSGTPSDPYHFADGGTVPVPDLQPYQTPVAAGPDIPVPYAPSSNEALLNASYTPAAAPTIATPLNNTPLTADSVANFHPVKPAQGYVDMGGQGAGGPSSEGTPVGTQQSQQPQMIPMTSTTTSHVDPAIQSALLKATNDQADATTKIGTLEQAGLKNEADVAQQRSLSQMGYINQANKIAEDNKSRNDTALNNYKNAIAQYAQQKIVPKSIFEDGNTGQNIAASIALAMGAFGGAMTGSNKNAALDIFNASIEKDMEAQKANMDKQGQVVNQTGELLRAARQAGMDEVEAKKFTLAQSQLAYADQLDAIGRSTASTTAQLRATEQAGKIRAIALGELSKEDKTQTTTSSVQAQLVGGNATEDTKKRVPAIYQQAETLNNIKKLYDAAGQSSGPLPAAEAALARSFGLTSTNSAELQAELNQALLGKVATSDISTRLSPYMQEELSKSVPELANNPAAFKGKIQTGLNDLQTEINSYRQATPNQRDIVLHDIEGATNRKTSFTANGTPGTYTPQVQPAPVQRRNHH